MFNMDWRYTKGRGIPLSNVPSIREDNGEQTLTVWHDCARPEAQSGARERRACNSCFLGVSGKTSQRKLYLRWTLKAHAEKGNHYGLTVLKKYLICLTSLWWATIFSLFLSLSLISILIKMKGIAIHSSILAWRIPWTEKSGGLQSMGSQRVRHNWATNTHTHTHTHTHTPL